MASVIRRFLAACAVTGVCASAGFGQAPVVKLGADTITPPPLVGAAASEEAGVKDLTPGIMPGLFDPLHNEGHAAGHGGGGHGEAHGHDGPGFYGTAEYLLLRPRRGAFDFALVDPNKDLIPGGNLESLNYEQRSGVRAGVGYRFSDSAWAAGFTYTFLRSGADRTLNSTPTGVIYPTLTRPGLIDNAGFAQATASLEYNVFDLEVGRQIHADERLNMRLYAGLRFATIRQDFDVLYDLRDANLARVRTKSNFDGFGPLLGGEGSLKTFGGFHIFGRAQASLLTGNITNPYAETQNDGGTLFATVDYRTRRVIPVMGAGVGVGWENRGVALRVGYEMTNWFNLIDQIRFTNDLAEGKLVTRPGDLSLEGLFVQLAIQY
jgi:hypothetical protein